MSDHTPGPWMFRRPEVGPLTDKKERELWPIHIDKQGTPGRTDWGVLIAQCWAHAPGSVDANARLIAAAPELLDACEAADRWGSRGEIDEDFGGYKAGTSVSYILERAMRKARGESVM